MSDLSNQEQLRDNIADILELSRESWKKNGVADLNAKGEEERAFPRSILFKSLSQHPALTAAAVASIWYLGPARFGAMAVAGAGLFLRHRDSILPIAQQLLSAALFNSKSPNSKEVNSKTTDE